MAIVFPWAWGSPWLRAMSCREYLDRHIIQCVATAARRENVGKGDEEGGLNYSLSRGVLVCTTVLHGIGGLPLCRRRLWCCSVTISAVCSSPALYVALEKKARFGEDGRGPVPGEGWTLRKASLFPCINRFSWILDCQGLLGSPHRSRDWPNSRNARAVHNYGLSLGSGHGPGTITC